MGRYEYTVAAWADHWVTWRTDLVKRLDAGQDVTVDLKIGANLVDLAVRRAAADGATEDAGALERWVARLRDGTAARGAQACRRSVSAERMRTSLSNRPRLWSRSRWSPFRPAD